MLEWWTTGLILRRSYDSGMIDRGAVRPGQWGQIAEGNSFIDSVREFNPGMGRVGLKKLNFIAKILVF